MQHKLISLIGGGNIAQAIVFGLLKQGYPAEFIRVCDSNPHRRNLFNIQGMQVSNDNVEGIQDAEVVLLAVKPQIMAEACASLSAVDFFDKLVISIVADISTARLTALLLSVKNIIRVMLNTPALVCIRRSQEKEMLFNENFSL